MFYDPNENQFNIEPDKEFEDKANLLTGKVDAVEDAARKIGIYVDKHHIAPILTPNGMTPALLIEATIGDIAWSPRVQNPESDDLKRQMMELEASMADDEFLDIRAKIERNLNEGKSPFAD